MKYLKIFEELINKKYFIDEDFDKIYIFELLNFINEEQIHVILKYKYYMLENEMEVYDDNKDIYKISMSVLNILYETDELKDAYEYLLTYIESKKYNL